MDYSKIYRWLVEQSKAAFEALRAAKKQATVNAHDWHNDPRFNEWIWEAFNRGYEWVHEDEAEREQRNTFYDWAFTVNAFEGVCL